MTDVALPIDNSYPLHYGSSHEAGLLHEGKSGSSCCYSKPEVVRSLVLMLSIAYRETCGARRQ